MWHERVHKIKSEILQLAESEEGMGILRVPQEIRIENEEEWQEYSAQYDGSTYYNGFDWMSTNYQAPKRVADGEGVGRGMKKNKGRGGKKRKAGSKKRKAGTREVQNRPDAASSEEDQQAVTRARVGSTPPKTGTRRSARNTKSKGLQIEETCHVDDDDDMSSDDSGSGE